MRNDLNSSRIKGIGLIEMALFIVSSGLMLAAASPIYHTYETHKHFDTTNNNLAITKTALDSYFQKNGRFPCPALRTAAIDTTGFGVENCAAAITTPGKSTVPDITDHNILIGAMPVRTLGLPDSAATDGWDHLLNYSIASAYTSKTAPMKDLLHGVVYVHDSKGNPATEADGTAVYVIAGANPDGTGAYNINGKLIAPCPAGTTGGASNCNDKGIFLSSTLQAAQGTKAVGNPIVIGGGSCVHGLSTGGGGTVGNISFLVDSSGSMDMNYDVIAPGYPATTRCAGNTYPQTGCINRITAAKLALAGSSPIAHDGVIDAVTASKAQNDPTSLVGVANFNTYMTPDGRSNQMRSGGPCGSYYQAYQTAVQNNAPGSQAITDAQKANTACLYGQGSDSSNPAGAGAVGGFPMSDVTAAGNGSGTTQLTPADYTAATAVLDTSVNSMTASGSTPLYDTMLAEASAIQNGSPSKQNILVVVSDGGDTASANSNVQLVQALTSLYPNLQVDFVYVGQATGNSSQGDDAATVNKNIFGTPGANGKYIQGKFIPVQNADGIKGALLSASQGSSCPQQ